MGGCAGGDAGRSLSALNANAAQRRIQSMFSAWFVLQEGIQFYYFRYIFGISLCVRLCATGGRNTKMNGAQLQPSDS